MKTLVVTVLDYEGVGGGGLELERSCTERHVEYEDVGGDCLGLERSWT